MAITERKQKPQKPATQLHPPPAGQTLSGNTDPSLQTGCGVRTSFHNGGGKVEKTRVPRFSCYLWFREPRKPQNLVFCKLPQSGCHLEKGTDLRDPQNLAWHGSNGCSAG